MNKKLQKLVILLAMMVVGASSYRVHGAQPNSIVLNPNGVSKIYPFFRTSGWTITQPVPGEARLTHLGDDYFAQDWTRTCGTTHGQLIYAPISGVLVVFGEQSGYGNTFVIYDSESGFAFRGAHMSAGAPGMHLGDRVVAGKTVVGFVGNTGFHANSACASDPGSHFHGALYKNVGNQYGRPITSVMVSGGPTNYAADYVFASSIPLVKGDQNPTVYALFSNGYRVPVSAFAFENHGWNFTTNRTYLNVVQTLPQSQINSMFLSSLFFPPRDGTLVRGTTDQTVFYIENGERRGVTGEVFNCRGFSYADVRTVDQGEVNAYPPNGNPPLLTGCATGGGGSTNPNPSFTFSASTAQTNSVVNQPVGISIVATNGSANATDVIVDAEIYNSAGNRVYQNFFEHQDFSSNQQRTYNFNWTPPATGTYTLKVAVFNNNWTTTYTWNDGVRSIEVGDGAPQPVTNRTAEVWWPSNGAQISGTQPFKAMVTNLALADYTMTWAVDNGQPIPLYDDLRDYPHKEAMVDVSGWTWRGAGPYSVKFVAKDLNGNVIAEQTVTIFIQQ